VPSERFGFVSGFVADDSSSPTLNERGGFSYHCVGRGLERSGVMWLTDPPL